MSTLTTENLLTALQKLPRSKRYLVAFSGGLDSTVLLHALVQLKRRLKRQLKPRLYAVHINHKLHESSQQWSAHCEAVARQLRVSFQTISLDLQIPQGESLEAVAREARYAALRSVMEPGDVLLTAQHQDDQLETFLLMALRGSGVAGLSGMAAVSRFEPGWLARPLLDVPRKAMLAWAEQEELDWLDDPSNADERFDRNYLRQKIVPLLKDRWPSAGETLSRSASLAAEADMAMQALAAGDWVRCSGRGGTLSVEPLAALPAARARNLLRFWLGRLGLPVPAEIKIRQVLEEALTAEADRNPHIHWQGGEIRRFQGELHAMQPLTPVPQGWESSWDTVNGPLALPADLGQLVLQPTGSTPAIDANAAQSGQLTVRFRRGGERLKPFGQPHTRELKTLLQEAGIPPWQRDRLPLLYQNEQLIAVADLWVADCVNPRLGTAGLRVAWQKG